jgi:hypothetical protein
MQAYQMTCSCGTELKVQANSRDEAVSKIQAMMGKDALAAHLREKHPGEPAPTLAQVHQMIAQNTAAA